MARFEGRLGQDTADGVGGEVGGQLAVRDDARFQPIEPGQQASRDPYTGTVLAQPVRDSSRALVAVKQVDRDLGDAAVEAHARTTSSLSSRDDSGEERTVPSQRKDRRSSACRLVGRAQRSPVQPAHGPDFRTVGQGHHYDPRMSELVPARQRPLYQRGPLRRVLLDTSVLTTDIIADGAVNRSTRVRGGRRSAILRRSALLPHRRGAALSFDVRPPRTEGAQPPCRRLRRRAERRRPWNDCEGTPVVDWSSAATASPCGPLM